MKHSLLLSLFFHISSVLSLPLHAQIVGRDVDLSNEYDFVILGGGLSALTVADRLSENPSGGSNIEINS
jgi:hypothetical protein